MSTKELKELFQKYLDKKASPEEVSMLLQHFRLNDEREMTEIIIAEAMKSDVTDNIISIKDASALAAVKMRIDAEIEKKERRKTANRVFIRIAISAAAVLILAVCYVMWQDAQDVRLITVTTRYAETKKLVLPDGSAIWLNAGTSVSYPQKFKNRQLTVNEGDVFFDVRHQPKAPFSITAGDVRVSVLGTSFEVSAYKNEHRIKVAVASGKVGVIAANTTRHSIFLTMGLQVEEKNGQLITSAVSNDDIAAWRDNRLVFDNEPLLLAMQSLERKYNVRITIANDSLLSQKVTMHLNNQPLGDILSALSFSNHIKYQIINDKSVIVR